MIKREDIKLGAEFINSMGAKIKLVFFNNRDAVFEYGENQLVIHRIDYFVNRFNYPEPPKPKTKNFLVADYYNEETRSLATVKIGMLTSPEWKLAIGSERTIEVEVLDHE